MIFLRKVIKPGQFWLKDLGIRTAQFRPKYGSLTLFTSVINPNQIFFTIWTMKSGRTICIAPFSKKESEEDGNEGREGGMGEVSVPPSRPELSKTIQKVSSRSKIQ